MHSTPARTAHRGRAALIGWFKALMTVAGIVLSCWAPVVGASAVTAAPAACRGTTRRKTQTQFGVGLGGVLV